VGVASDKYRSILQVGKYLSALLALAGCAFGQNVLTGGNDNYRTNANLAETILTPAKVSSSSFGRLFTLAVDGQIYAQPLFQRNLTMADGSTHNVVFVATMHNSVYAFDADVAGLPLWTVNLGPSVPSANYASDTGAYSDILPENGILGTPVIDPTTGTLYAVAATLENGAYIYRLHALDTTSGAEKFGAPTTIAAQVTGLGDNSMNGSVAFDASQHLQRPALLLANGIVYVAFGSHGDSAPYHGWVMSYSAVNVQTQLAVFNASPNGSAGAIWQSGRGPAADDSGNVYIVSSNGSSDFATNFSDSVLKLDPSQLTIADWFAPFNFQFLADNDEDLGSAGALLIPGSNFLVTGGKQGNLYLLNSSALGQTTPNDSQVLQSLNLGGFGLFNMALWNRADGPLLYTHISSTPVAAYRLTGGQFSSQPVAQALSGFSIPFQGMQLTANGSTPGSGILWVTAANTWPLPGPGVLVAYNADDMSQIWSDNYGTFVKFANPTVAGGKVFVPTLDNQLMVYGLQYNTAYAPAVTSIVNAASYANGAISPGELVAVYGQNMGPQTLAVAGLNSYGNIGTQLRGTTVTFNGIPGPVLYTSSGAVAAIVPYAIAGSATATVQVSYYGQVSSSQTVPVSATTPGIFAADASGSGPGAILNADYSLNSPSNPAAAGSIAIVYGTGGGQTNPGGTDGAITSAAMPLTADCAITVGGQAAQVLYAGDAGGEVQGVTQFNIQLPQGVTGTVPIVIRVGSSYSSSTVTVSIH
jgi:uncharacterized protein (TIGR03437 family)